VADGSLPRHLSVFRRIRRNLLVELLVFSALLRLGFWVVADPVAGIQIQEGSGTVVRYSATTSSYYTLFSGGRIDSITNAVDMALGVSGQGQFRLNQSGEGLRFFQILELPVTAPLDADADRIDDVWELRFRSKGAALNGLDGDEDQNGNGVPDWKDYSGVADIPSAGFELVESIIPIGQKEAAVVVRFDRAVKLSLSVWVGGDALEGVDFASFPKVIPVDGTTATIRVPLVAGANGSFEKRLILSIAEPPGPTPSYRARANRTHEMHLMGSRTGRYTGTLTVTNGFFLSPHPVVVTVLANGPESKAVFEMEGGPLLKASVEVPVQLTGGRLSGILGKPAGFFAAETIRRRVEWSLEFGAIGSTASGTLEGQFELRVSGLSASGRGQTARGLLRLMRDE
jgi:hypothetical protein